MGIASFGAIFNYYPYWVNLTDHLALNLSVAHKNSLNYSKYEITQGNPDQYGATYYDLSLDDIGLVTIDTDGNLSGVDLQSLVNSFIDGLNVGGGAVFQSGNINDPAVSALLEVPDDSVTFYNYVPVPGSNYQDVIATDFNISLSLSESIDVSNIMRSVYEDFFGRSLSFADPHNLSWVYDLPSWPAAKNKYPPYTGNIIESNFPPPTGISNIVNACTVWDCELFGDVFGTSSPSFAFYRKIAYHNQIIPIFYWVGEYWGLNANFPDGLGAPDIYNFLYAGKIPPNKVIGYGGDIDFPELDVPSVPFGTASNGFPIISHGYFAVIGQDPATWAKNFNVKLQNVN